MADTSYRFSQRVDNYIQYRPHYPPVIIGLLRARCQLTRQHLIGDVGSGTGILAKLFLENGNPVIGVEPDPDMRAGAAYFLRDFPAYSSQAGTAEGTRLPDQSVDFVTVGQAFHWFILEQAREEFARFLSPRGWVVLVWNVQRTTATPFLTALQRFWENESFWKESTRLTSQQIRRAQAYRLDTDLVRRELLDPFFGPGNFNEAVLANPLICDFEGLKGRILSNDAALEPDDPNFSSTA